ALARQPRQPPTQAIRSAGGGTRQRRRTGDITLGTGISSPGRPRQHQPDAVTHRKPASPSLRPIRQATMIPLPAPPEQPPPPHPPARPPPPPRRPGDITLGTGISSPGRPRQHQPDAVTHRKPASPSLRPIRQATMIPLPARREQPGQRKLVDATRP